MGWGVAHGGTATMDLWCTVILAYMMPMIIQKKWKYVGHMVQCLTWKRYHEPCVGPLMCWSHAPPCVALWWIRSQVQTFPFQGCVVGLEVAHGGTLLLCVLCVFLFYMYQVYMDLSSGSHVSVPSPMGLPFVVGVHTDDVHFRCRMRRCSVEGWHMVGLVWWDYYTNNARLHDTMGKLRKMDNMLNMDVYMWGATLY